MRRSAKSVEPEIVDDLRSLRSLRKNRPQAQIALKNATKQVKTVLSRRETAYQENFYRIWLGTVFRHLVSPSKLMT
jgi:hypothetical protein